jgi:hypothetical protein
MASAVTPEIPKRKSFEPSMLKSFGFKARTLLAVCIDPIPVGGRLHAKLLIVLAT